MPPESDEVKARMEDLRRSFLDQLPDRMRDLDAKWRKLAGEGWSGAAFQEFHRSVHGLAGSAGMFGHRDVSDRARELEVVLRKLGDGSTPPDGPTAGQIGAGLDEMNRAARRPPTP